MQIESFHLIPQLPKGSIFFLLVFFIYTLTLSAFYLQNDQYHPVWGQMDSYSVGKEKRKQLLLMLCQYEADRLEVWAQPINSK